MSSRSLSRRHLLVSTGLAVALAGCAGEPRNSGETDSDADSNATDTAETTSAGEGTTTRPAATRSTDATASGSPDSDTATVAPTDTAAVTTETELDLREANVVGVEFEQRGGSYRFSVTLYHDDDGEDGYADWWQVETLAGDRLGRRTLLHAHSTAPFTRSETVTVPDDVAHVVVRGHDQTHGYGGQAMVVSLADGQTEAVRQGSEPRDFSDYEPSV